MKLLKYVLPLAVATCGFAATMNAAEFATVQEARERDDSAVTDFVKSKRSMSLQDKGNALVISGTVRAEWAHMYAKTDGHKQRGLGSRKLDETKKPHAPFATDEFNTQVHLMFDYKTDRTWTAVDVQLDNGAGIKEIKREDAHSDRNILWGSGTGDRLMMRKAYVGCTLSEEGTSRWDLEFGRRRLYDAFDSQVQFYSIFDGLLLKYANSFEGSMDLTAKAAAFVVDYTVNHFAYVAELGLLNLGDSGFDLKYSVIDWDTKSGKNRYGKKHAKGNEFLNHQFAFAYNVSPDMMQHKTKLYSAYLHNSEAQKSSQDDAWYIGVKVGEVKRQGDWSFDLQYQMVEAYAVPENDVSGIGKDNPQKVSIYDHKWGGFANYQGWRLNGFYAFTDNWTLNAFYERARQESRKVGGKHRNNQFEIAAIYAF